MKKIYGYKIEVTVFANPDKGNYYAKFKVLESPEGESVNVIGVYGQEEPVCEYITPIIYGIKNVDHIIDKTMDTIAGYIAANTFTYTELKRTVYSI